MNLNDDIYAELRSFDSVQYFPNNTAASFKVQFDQELRFEGQWQLALKWIKIDCSSEERHFEGKELYIYTDIIDFSFVGGSLKQLLKRVSLGPALYSNNRISYGINGAENNCCCCYYKRITIPNCLSIEIRVEDDKGNLIDLSAGCTVILSMHFRRTSQK